MTNESDKFLISRAAAAHMLAVDVRSLSTYQKRDIDPLPVAVRGARRGQSHRYDPQALMKWKVRQELAQLSIDDGELLDLNNERARLAKLQAQKVQLDLDERNGQLVDVEATGELIDKLFAGCRAHLLGLPNKAAPEIHGCRTIPETAEEIRKHVYESLSELSTTSVADIMGKATSE